VARIWAGTERAEQVLGWTATRDLAEMLADHWRWQEANPDGFGD
jgi:UDP-glucose 4-epimerase